MKENPRTSLFRHVAVGMICALATLAAHSQTPADNPDSAASEETVKLPAFDVTSTATDKYNASESASAARTSAPILDTPITVNVLTPALIQDINPSDMFDVTSYFAGVSSNRGANINERQTFRGFESFSRTVDNFSGAMMPYMYAPFDDVDPIFVDHAELIMGPDTILSPTGTPGGTLSIYTKSPQFTRGTDISAEFGNYNADKYSIDTTGPLGDGHHMAYRVILGYQDSETYLPGAYIAFAGAAEFTYKFSDTAKLTVKYFGSQQRNGGTDATPGVDGEEVYTPNTVNGATISTSPQPGFQYAGWNGVATWSSLITRDNTVEAELTAALGDRVSMRMAGQIAYDEFQLIRAYPSPVLTETFNPQTGQETAVTAINPAALPEVAQYYHYMSRQIQYQNDFAGHFDAGGVSLQPTIGWASQQGEMPVDYIVNDKTMPAANLAAGYYAPPMPALSAYKSLSSNTPMNGWTLQGYALLRAGFLNDRIFVTAGTARVWAGVNEYSIPYLSLPNGISAGTVGPATRKTFSSTLNPLMPSVKPWHDTYMAGLLGKVLPNVSLYYNFSTNAGLASAAPMWQAGAQNEVGVKSNFMNNRITVSADYFSIKQNNISYQNPLFTTGQSNVQTIFADLDSRGEEINIVGGVTNNLSAIASFTNQELRDAFGRPQRNIPDTLANLLLNYRFTTGAAKNANVFVGVQHEGKAPGEAVTAFTSLGVPEQPGFYLPSYTVVNLGAGYKWRNYRFSLNVDNALNQRAWWQAQARSSIAPFPGTTVDFTITVHL